VPNVKGALGEALAELFLKQRGFLILARNFRTPFGEIDLIAQEGETVVFIEVKSLYSANLAPEESIGRRKKEHLKRAALAFLKEKGWLARLVRFDVVTIRFCQSTPGSRIEHLPDVFSYP